MVLLSLEKTKAVVIKAQAYKENDKLVWLYTEEFGKVTAIARGTKKSKSRLFALTLPLCYADYVLFKGKNLFNLQEGKIENSFQGLLSNLEKLTYSSYICELIDICLEDGENNKQLYKDFIKCLYLLNTDALNYEMLIRSFELKLLKSTGYGLNLDQCVSCRKKITVTNYISISHFGGVCEMCNRQHGMYISKPAYNALRFLNNTDMEKVYRLNINSEVKKDISKVNTLLISSNYARKPKSLEMLNYIKE
ncbi:DNA repair protein RecO [Clostridium gasigenes]|uniref:DNA repair protein RecO n=1 Tax=Clostridium gasigenes TaxID=94869 RepID=A0A1H0TWH7_9CLOT|nr:DNA repair protein RecO [Clostridium gasigenes]MBB6624307.1 DNA repair protein RecO [Clostridium gasigenes]MBB6714694.1 DNA repair protein RecO [Clostridium gasigenes]MBU3089238.1 DNA repair protein RecO [Clostridium gasigenes]MBU3105233.1 DNA repair protein RecO [Clostridium gasigenes]MBU3132059.1 DNA repair protein RecO [Clostridium gasigenes]